MMRRIASFISALVLVLLILPFSADEAKAEMLTGYPSESALIDELGLYDNDPATFSELDTLIKQKAKELDLHLIVFLSGRYRYESEAVIFADDSYDEIFEENTDGIFYYLDLSGGSPANDVISTSGRAVLTYEAHKDEIFSGLDAYLPASGNTVYPNEIKTAIMAYLKYVERYAHDAPSPFAYHYDSNSRTYAYYKHGEYTVSKHKPLVLYLKPFLISGFTGLIVALITYAVSKNRYKFKGGTDPKIYLSRNSSQFRQNQNIFIRKDTSRTHISTSSSGGGRSGGYHSGGGSHHSHSGHHGGGVHHR